MYEWIGQLTADEGRLRKVRHSLRYVPNFIIMFICSAIGTVNVRCIREIASKNST